jgi:hypothetical protein
LKFDLIAVVDALAVPTSALPVAFLNSCLEQDWIILPRPDWELPLSMNLHNHSAIPFYLNSVEDPIHVEIPGKPRAVTKGRAAQPADPGSLGQPDVPAQLDSAQAGAKAILCVVRGCCVAATKSALYLLAVLHLAN